MKWALVLGGSNGLGLACARRLARDGFAICAVYREPRASLAQAQSAMGELRELAPRLLDFNVNALSQEGINTVLAELARRMSPGDAIGVVVHSIAHGSVKPMARAIAPGSTDRAVSGSDEAFGDSSPEALFDAAYRALAKRRATETERELLQPQDVQLTVDAMGVNLFTWVNVLLAKGMLADDTRVIGLTSEGARRVWRGYSAVSAAKAALEALVRAMAVELGPLGIRANLVQAGITDTRSLRHIPEQQLMRLGAERRNPLGRLTEPSDVANAVSLLCRPEAAWINGATLAVDGGEHLC